MEVKAGYKQTELGVIPEDWKVEPIGEAYEICNNLRLPISRTVRKQMEGPYPYYGPTSIQGYINEYRVEGEYALIGEDGDHFLKWQEQPMTLLVRGRFNVNNHAHLIKGTKNLTEWFYYYFAHRDITPYLTRQGAGRFKLNKRTLMEIPCALPPTKTEQEAIAEALSDADAFIEALEQLIAKKCQIKQGAMQELLTGKRRLPGFGRKWEEKIIGSFADVKTGPFGSALHERDYVSQGTPLITVEHLSENGLVHSNMSMVSDFDVQRLKTYTVQVNDIVFSRVGVVDRNSVIKKDEEGWLFSGSLLRLRVIKDDIHAPFISYFFYSEPFRNYVLSMAVGQTRLSLNTKIISNTPITIPSFEEQTAIAEILSDMDAEIAALEGKLSKARQVKQGMMQELLTGRVRLVTV